MPRQDKTGPEGKGSKTGRQMGNCEGTELVGRGFGCNGQGRGFGRGYWCRQPITKEEEKKVLEAEKKQIENRLKELIKW